MCLHINPEINNVYPLTLTSIQELSPIKNKIKVFEDDEPGSGGNINNFNLDFNNFKIKFSLVRKDDLLKLNVFFKDDIKLPCLHTFLANF